MVIKFYINLQRDSHPISSSFTFTYHTLTIDQYLDILYISVLTLATAQFSPAWFDFRKIFQHPALFNLAIHTHTYTCPIKGKQNRRIHLSEFPHERHNWPCVITWASLKQPHTVELISDAIVNLVRNPHKAKNDNPHGTEPGPSSKHVLSSTGTNPIPLVPSRSRPPPLPLPVPRRGQKQSTVKSASFLFFFLSTKPTENRVLYSVPK